MKNLFDYLTFSRNLLWVNEWVISTNGEYTPSKNNLLIHEKTNQSTVALRYSGRLRPGGPGSNLAISRSRETCFLSVTRIDGYVVAINVTEET